MKGKIGEDKAVDYLVDAGMKVIDRNYRSKYGEIDIVAQLDETIIFVEVKNWSAFGADDLQISLDSRKQQKIIKTAKFFLFKNRKYSNMAIRFDVVFVKNNSVTHLASAFVEGV